MLYQPPSGGDFRIMREEQNFLDNAAAKQIAAQGGSVDAAWAKLSANCPNYKPDPLPEASSSTIGYSSVAGALDDLHKQPGVKFSTQDGWTLAMVEGSDTVTLWSFAPPGHPAYPSAVKRQLVNEPGGVSIKMDVHCEASKSACDDLVRSFEQLNERMKADMARRR
jgi:hypothetical protein